MAESNQQAEAAAEGSGAHKSEEDIDSLLDSALDDFSKVSLETPSTQTTLKSENSTIVGEGETETIWSEMFKEALQADPAMREMFKEGGEGEKEFFQDFAEIAKAAARALEGDSSNSFEDIVSDTLRNLQENSELSRNQFGDPEQMANLFQEMGLTGDALRQDGNLEDIPPFLQNIMQQFLSKDILYPSIKDFVERYPAWLESNKDTLSQEQYDNYNKQLELMKKVVEEFEAETETDGEDVKKQRFQRIMALLQQMQALGQPPAELILTDGVLDEANLPNLPPGMDPQQCCLM